MKRIATISCFFLVLGILCSKDLIYSEQKKELTSLKNDVSAIEKELFELANKERKKISLSSLQLSQDLSLLARKHSLDMASQGKISHSSSSGKSYKDRVVEAGFYFISLGENVAFSETFLTAFIHQGFMESPGHRENILSPDFDQVGIGVVFKEDKGYFITQDFRESLLMRDIKEVEEDIQQKINGLRRENSLPPLTFLEEANRYAQKYSLSKFENKPPPQMPSHFGENYILSIASPSLTEAFYGYKEMAMDKIYESAGLGVSFGKNKKYPGGSYFITLILFVENRYKSWSNKDLKDTIFHAINKIRGKKGLNPFEQDTELSSYAEKTIKRVFALRNDSPSVLPKIPGTAILYYITEDPTQLPRRLKENIKNDLKDYKRIGVGILFGKNPEYPRAAFWVSILLKE